MSESLPPVFVTRAIAETALTRLKAACAVDLWPEEAAPPYDVLVDKARRYAGLLIMVTDRIDAALMDAGKDTLRVISQMAVGYDNIDVAAAQARGLPIGHTPGVLTDATADLTLALILAAARRLVEAADYVRAGQWRTWHPGMLLGADIGGSTLGIIGLGRIGQAVARRAAAFDMRIIAYSPSASSDIAAQVSAQRVDLETLLREADFVTIHAPLKPDTRHLIDADALAKMKPTAMLINTARGSLVDQSALTEALRSGAIAGAALDVTDPEPIAPDDPLLAMPNVIILPHIGSASRGTREKMAHMAVDNLLAGINGQPLPHPVWGK